MDPVEKSADLPADSEAANDLPTARPLFRSTWWFLWGLLFPGAYLLLAAGFDEVEWQTGALSDYAILLHNWPCLVFVYPMAIFSAVGLGTLLWGPEGVRQLSWVRFALFSGVIVWLELWVAWCFGVGGPFEPESPVFLTLTCPLIGAVVTLPFFGIAYGDRNLNSAAAQDRNENQRALVFVLCLILLLCTLAIAPIWLFVLVPAAPLALATYGWAAIVCFKSIPKEERRLSLKMAMLIVTWLSANFAAWRFAVNLMLAEYAALPTEPPQGCFVATAAARGHRVFVGSDLERPINRQLRTLTAGELLLRRTAPRLHRRTRTIYNGLGPRAAGLLTNRWLADAAYVGLKPCEWFARLLLLAAGVKRDQVDSLYRFD
ncbi:MAG: DUF6688 family protein [Planctomycetota bacterium]